MSASEAEGARGERPDDPGTGGQFGPWNPGLVSQIPRRYLPLATIYRPENISNDLAEIEELADFSGLSAHEIARFRPERLAVHELLVRVMADFSVPDGPNYEDLGISFREICTCILDDHITPNIESVRAAHRAVEDAATAFIERELDERLYGRPVPQPAAAPVSWWRRLIGASPPAAARPAAAPVGEGEREARAIAHWSDARGHCDDPLERAALDALARVVTLLVSRRGRAVGGRDVVVRLAVTLVANAHGSEAVGQVIEPMIAEAARARGDRLLPAQEKPVVMNAKGASASGKSTTRPQQRGLADRLGVDWRDFALISPDIWRKFLLDYDALGEAYKYAGAFTSHEVEIIDLKLDRYMARKSAAGRMSHLLIDRFRFDSFTVDQDETSSLLTRFGDLIFMFFMITPPHMTVERAWLRGLKFGRYKSVDDLLHHNVEAFTGMPRLFFSWAGMTRKRVHYEFLDNSVDEGELPHTAAFGWNGAMTVLDVGRLLDIERFRRVDIEAKSPEAVYASAGSGAGAGGGEEAAFLRECARQLDSIDFADQRTGRVYARMEEGKWVWWNEAGVSEAMEDDDTRAGLAALGWEHRPDAPDPARNPGDIAEARLYTLGDWGGGAA